MLKEMGYRIARKHAAKLRRLVHLLAFGLPLAADGAVGAAAAIVAVLAHPPGMLAERCLFFAEARHLVTLDYGR